MTGPLGLSQSLDGRRLDGSAGGGNTGEQRGKRRHAKHGTVGSPLEREYSVTIQAEHHIGPKPAEQGAQHHTHHAGDERQQ